jgi:hypothetical protein
VPGGLTDGIGPRSHGSVRVGRSSGALVKHVPSWTGFACGGDWNHSHRPGKGFPVPLSLYERVPSMVDARGVGALCSGWAPPSLVGAGAPLASCHRGGT